MPPRHILSPQSRTALFSPPTEPAAIVRHYTFSPEDMALIRQRRRAANRLGFAVHLAYLRFPGRVLGAEETPPAEMLAFIASQMACDPSEFLAYARRGETRREHLGELQTYLDLRPFRRDDYRAVAHVAIEQATGSDRGDAIVSAMIEHLRERRSASFPSRFGTNRVGGPCSCSQAGAQKSLRGNIPRDHRRSGGLARRQRRTGTHAARVAAGMAREADAE